METTRQFTIKCQICPLEIGPFPQPAIAGYEAMRVHSEQVHAINTSESDTRYINLDFRQSSKSPRLGTLYVARPGIPWALVEPQ